MSRAAPEHGGERLRLPGKKVAGAKGFGAGRRRLPSMKMTQGDGQWREADKMRVSISLLAFVSAIAQVCAQQPGPGASGSSVAEKQPPSASSIVVIDAKRIQVGATHWRLKGY